MSETVTKSKVKATACRSVHPEDITIGDHVVVLHQSFQVGTYVWCGLDAHQFPPSEPVEITFRGNFEALTVKEVCLPFVLCCDDESNVVVLDVRGLQIGRLSKRFAKAHRKALKLASEKETAKKKKKRKNGKR